MDTPQICRLRPLEQGDLPLFEEIYSSRAGAGEHQWFGFSPPGRGLAEIGAIGGQGGRLTVVTGHQVIGSAFWFRRDWGLPDTSWCWEIALHVFPDHRSRGHGQHALAQLAAYLFAHTLAWRVQAITDVANTAGQALLERGGFTREGTLRGVQWREGRWHDQHIYSLLRPDSSSPGTSAPRSAEV